MVAMALSRSGLGTWCGWVVIGGLALTPLLGWLGPMGFAVLLGVMGLLSLPAVTVTDEDRPAAVLLLLVLIWAAISTVWSPYHPSKPGNNSALKLAFELPLFWAAMCGARRADPQLKIASLRVLAWGSALFGVVLLAEFATDAMIYEKLHFAFYEPIRHDLAEVNIGHSTFVLALIWPLALAAAIRTRTTPWLAVPMVAGTVAAALRFGSDAPVISVVLVAVVGASVWRWPRSAPKTLAVAAAIYSLAAPLIVWAVRASGDYRAIQDDIPLSWAERMGYWSHALDWIKDHPLRGWGLDASRMFGPGIVLHPHDDALQLWLELGVLGALLAAAFWAWTLRRLVRPAPDVAVAAVAASASVYLLFGALNFGVWQEWWLGLGALVAVVAALLLEPPSAETST
jgi:O-antigen ligase